MHSPRMLQGGSPERWSSALTSKEPELEWRVRVHTVARARWVPAPTLVFQASAFFLGEEAPEDGEQMEIELLTPSACL